MTVIIVYMHEQQVLGNYSFLLHSLQNFIAKINTWVLPIF